MTNQLNSWISSLSARDLRGLVMTLAHDVDGAAARIEVEMLSETNDITGLRSAVDDYLAPRRSFYDYGGANAYAREAGDVVDLLVQAAAEPDIELLPVIERALTLLVRTILRSDDSSGYQGSLVHTLMSAHAGAACGLAGQLTAKDRRRLVDWLIKFRYGGKQDFFDPDVVAYAPALGEDGVARYRAAIEKIDLGPYGRYPLERLAVLAADADEIVAAHRGEPHNALLAERLVASLMEAELHEDAVRYARLGLTLPAAERAESLADVLVADAIGRGEIEAALQQRRDRFAQHPSSTTFHQLESTARDVGVWDRERASAEAVLRDRIGWYYLGHLLHEGRDEEAWAHAIAHPGDARSAGVWSRLLDRRGRTHPAETLPHYRDLVTNTLAVAKRSHYHAAAEHLLAMRSAAQDGGVPGEYDRFLAQVLEENRRRPACLEIFRRHKVT